MLTEPEAVAPRRPAFSARTAPLVAPKQALMHPGSGLTPFRLIGVQLSSRIGRINRFELACPSGHYPGKTMPNLTTASGIRDNHRRGVVADSYFNSASKKRRRSGVQG